MSIDPRLALSAFTSALEEHLLAVADRRGEADPAVDAAFNAVADTFEAYSDALYDSYSEELPFDLDGEEDDRDDDGDLDEREDEEDEED